MRYLLWWAAFFFLMGIVILVGADYAHIDPKPLFFVRVVGVLFLVFGAKLLADTFGIGRN